MPIRPYTIIEIFRSKGFDSKEAEEIVDFITESSQGNVLEAIKPLATSSEVKTLGSKVETLDSEVKTLDSEVKTLSSEVKALSSEVKALSSEVKALDLRVETLSLEVKSLDNKIDALETKLSDKIELRIKDTELRLIKWLTGTGIAIIGILIAAMKYIIK